MIEQKNTLAEMLTGKKDLLRLFVLATVLAFSVGILASLVAAQTAVPTVYVYSVAGALTALALILLAADLRFSMSFEDKLEGVLFLNPEKNELLPVKGYELSKDLTRVLAAVKAESRSIYSEWDTSPLVPKKAPNQPAVSTDAERIDKPSYIGIYRVTVAEEPPAPPKAVRLLDEAILFVLLDELSTHLSTYFNDSSDDEHISKIHREDIPAFLLQNRVLNLLTTPIEQRDVFMSAFPDNRDRPEGELHSLWGSDGAMYSRFDLTLPKHTRVSHTDTGSIRIETKRLDLEISGRYTGSSAVASRAFVGQYLGKRWEDVDCRKVQVVLRCRIKPLALLSTKGWEHYRWLDSFRLRLRRSVDFNAFLEGIHWEMIEPVLYSLRGQFAAMRTRTETVKQPSSEA